MKATLCSSPKIVEAMEVGPPGPAFQRIQGAWVELHLPARPPGLPQPIGQVPVQSANLRLVPAVPPPRAVFEQSRHPCLSRTRAYSRRKTRWPPIEQQPGPNRPCQCLARESQETKVAWFELAALALLAPALLALALLALALLALALLAPALLALALLALALLALALAVPPLPKQGSVPRCWPGQTNVGLQVQAPARCLPACRSITDHLHPRN